MKAEVFWDYVLIGEPSECWPWLGARHKDEKGAYGNLRFDGSHKQAHRVAFFLVNDYWPLIAMHECDNPPCCNPLHVIDGTRGKNTQDMYRKGRFHRSHWNRGEDGRFIY